MTGKVTVKENTNSFAPEKSTPKKRKTKK